MTMNTFTIWFLKIALSASFLSAVADRFGLWGPAGTAGVSWGNFESFTAYTAKVNPLVPQRFIPLLAWAATVLETSLGVLLLTGIMSKEVALAAAVLLAIFALSMAFGLGIKSPLDYSVFSACAAAVALYVLLAA